MTEDCDGADSVGSPDISTDNWYEVTQHLVLAARQSQSNKKHFYLRHCLSLSLSLAMLDEDDTPRVWKFRMSSELHKSYDKGHLITINPIVSSS